MKQNVIALIIVVLVLALGVFFIIRYEGITPNKSATETEQGSQSSEDPAKNENYSADDVSSPDTIVCVIGDDEYSFTMEDFIAEMYRIMPNDFEETMSKLSAPDQKMHREQLENQVMDFLIEAAYVELYFKDSGMSISQEEIEEEKEKIRQSLRDQSGKPDLDVAAYFENMGVTDEMFTEDMKSQIMFRKVFSPLMDNVKVSDKEIQDYYKENADKFDVPDRVNIDVIITYDEEKVNEIMQKYNDGVSFEDLAVEYSEDPTMKENKGAVGWVTEAELPPEMNQHIFNDAEYGNSDIISFQMETVFYIVRRNDKETAHTPSFDEIKEKVEAAALDVKREKVYKDFIEEQKKQYGEPVVTPDIVYPSDVVTSTIPPNTLPGMEGMIDQYMEGQTQGESAP